jgi:hypothetical protein
LAKREQAMKKPSPHSIQDKAEISIDFPDKFYMGSFSRDSKFEARAEDDGLFIKLTRLGDQRRQVEIHLHHHLLADILSEWAASLENGAPMRVDHRNTLLDSLANIQDAIRALDVADG